MPRTNSDYVREILRLEGLLRAYLHRFAPKPADLDDLLQETYSRLLGLSSEQRNKVQNIQAFALTSARNVALDWVRHRQVVLIDLVEDLDNLPVTESGGSLDDIVNTHQQLLKISEAVAHLPERCREVFTLRKVYGWSQREIARHLSITEQTVEQHLVKGMRRCAELLADTDQAETASRMSWLGGWRRRKSSRGGQG